MYSKGKKHIQSLEEQVIKTYPRHEALNLQHRDLDFHISWKYSPWDKQIEDNVVEWLGWPFDISLTIQHNSLRN